VIYLTARMIIFGRLTAPVSSDGAASLVTRISQVPAITLEYLRLILVPVHLSAEHPADTVLWMSVPWYLLWIPFVAGIVWLAIRFRKIDRTVAFGLFWCLTGLLPALNIIPLAVPILEHRLYAVIPGMLIVAGRYAGDPGRWPAGYRRPVFTLTIVILAAAATCTALRSRIWKNSESLWLDTIEKAPAAGRPYFNLAGYYYEQGEYGKATEYVTRYIALRPDQPVGYEKLRQIFVSTGKYPEAIRICEELTAHQQSGGDPYREADRIFRYLDQAAGTKIGLDASFAPFTVRMGVFFESQNDTPAAAGYYRRAIGLDPDYGPAYFRLGRLSALHGDVHEAIALIERGRRAFPAPPEVADFLDQLQQSEHASAGGKPR
jgi:protein O-mannosyl-transferase